MLQVFGEQVRVTEAMDCRRSGDHRKLVAEARVDYLKSGVLPDDKFALCGRCGQAVSLKI
jgi:predicted PP-loop superfamily ATPase